MSGEQRRLLTEEAAAFLGGYDCVRLDGGKGNYHGRFLLAWNSGRQRAVAEGWMVSWEAHNEDETVVERRIVIGNACSGNDRNAAAKVE